MERIDLILSNPGFVESVRKCEEYEKDRVFCRHGFDHLTDVARIARILNSEEAKGVDNELLYAAALLHDCGRYIQYETGIRHEEAGAQPAGKILSECGFSEEEIRRIVNAIKLHRNREEAFKEPLSELIYRADKLSRDCYFCKAAGECNRAPEKRNTKFVI